MKFGALTDPLLPIEKEIRLLKKMGFDFVEIAVEAPATPEVLLEKKDKIKRILSKLKMDAMIHVPIFVSIADLYESIRNASQEEVLKSLDLAVEIGVERLVIHKGSARGLGKRLKDVVRRYEVEFFKRLTKKARELGLILLLENLDGLNEIEDLEFFFRRFKKLKFTLDVGHANLFAKENRSIKLIRKFRRRLMHIHLHDNLGRRDDHLPIGCGNIDFLKIFKELKRIKFDETMTLEVFTRDRDYQRISLEKVKKLWRRA